MRDLTSGCCVTFTVIPSVWAGISLFIKWNLRTLKTGRNQTQKATYSMVPSVCNALNGQIHRDRALDQWLPGAGGWEVTLVGIG